MTLDVERHRALVARQERGLGLANRFLDRRVPGVTNWNSPRQVNWWLQDALPDDLYSRWPKTPKSRALQLGGEVIKPMLPEMPANLRRILSTYLLRKDRAKLVASFGEALIEKVRPETGRVHTSLYVCAVVTGRMSASEPNLQQIPRKKAFRNLFTVPDGQKLIVADYSQIEIPVAALLSKEPVLYNAFADGADIHQATAAGMFKIPDDQVSREQRQRAKEITFGMLYGMGKKSLAGALGVSRAEAQVWVRAWWMCQSEIAGERNRNALKSLRGLQLSQSVLPVLIG
ncbi:DNA polymerase [Flavobacteriaceae bacterium]|nr:DNA polymerase [Flavobacteriaceae bacterium]